ncbi:C-type lectin family protein [Turkeypox virus]|uniref:C-type lectin family protein n=1 Tax=Turkeypox virus TaxID=336486 RepID=A0A0M3ZPQ8_9POXV|nr:C-type lectin family protein [Turkeypox virus]ALA62539.1 C-type lectin family protein [Turkeypox virus]
MDDNNCSKNNVIMILVPCGGIIFALAIIVAIFCINPPNTVCGEEWIQYGKKCYYFSTVTNNKTTASSECKSMNGKLASIDNAKEANFMLRYNCGEDHWIGIERSNDNTTWVNEDGKPCNDIIVKGNGVCAYLGNGLIESTICSDYKKWICCYTIY